MLVTVWVTVAMTKVPVSSVPLANNFYLQLVESRVGALLTLIVMALLMLITVFDGMY